MFTLKQIKERIRSPYAWPGGYPVFFVMSDGESLSIESAHENWREIVDAKLTSDETDQWYIEGESVNWENSSLFCVHSNKLIESAYDDVKLT